MSNDKRDLVVIRQIMALQNKTTKELHDLWDKMFSVPPAVASKQHMIAKLAYRMQELAYGGLDEATENKIQAAVREISKPRKINEKPYKKFLPMLGTRIVKEYRGAMHEVMVVSNGFAYAGAIYSSLSAVAQKITGTKWNGYKFFQLSRSEHNSF
ncbi:MAG: DUF2924 domain-containing protein [Holosporaceae bacterium]|jgi:hypothetical protein|nr:DUF2924 domain-containing protein [Holosporaceae bacterium]